MKTHISTPWTFPAVSGLLLYLMLPVEYFVIGAADEPTWSLPSAKSVAVSQKQSAAHIAASLQVPLPKPSGMPTAASLDGSAAPRGPEAIAVYSKAAPAVVYVTDGETGHGTGFFISDDGWLLTNNHVVEHMPYSAEHGAQTARIVYGSLDADGAMNTAQGYLEAIVYRRDERRDLALLKVIALPDSRTQVPFIKLGAASPANGLNCFAIGHPSSGVLWTLRYGIVSGRGKFPHDNINFMVRGADPAVARQVTERFASVPSRLVTLSSCGVNPGDSGGPLLNEAAELIAVTFAIPAEVRDKSFAYHVHLDEVKAFLADRPKVPEIIPPSDQFDGDYVSLADLDEDGVADARLFQPAEDASPIALQIDLDQDSSAKRRKSKGGLFTAEADEAAAEWDYEFAISLQPRPTLYFDTDEDGAVDLIVQTDGMSQETHLRLVDGQWSIDELRNGVPGAPFADSKLNTRYQAFARGMGIRSGGKRTKGS